MRKWENRIYGKLRQRGKEEGDDGRLEEVRLGEKESTEMLMKEDYETRILRKKGRSMRRK